VSFYPNTSYARGAHAQWHSESGARGRVYFRKALVANGHCTGVQPQDHPTPSSPAATSARLRLKESSHRLAGENRSPAPHGDVISVREETALAYCPVITLRAKMVCIGPNRQRPFQAQGLNGRDAINCRYCSGRANRRLRGAGRYAVVTPMLLSWTSWSGIQRRCR